MTGINALLHINEGKSVRRKSWKPDEYIQLTFKHDPKSDDENWFDITSLLSDAYVIHQENRCHRYHPDQFIKALITHVIVDFFADDWEIYNG
jgi:hypothetical protein